MICPHPRPAEEEGERGGIGLDLWVGTLGLKCKMGEIADKRLTTEDNVGCLMVWIQGVRRWRRGRGIKQKDICHFPELVILHSLLAG